MPFCPDSEEEEYDSNGNPRPKNPYKIDTLSYKTVSDYSGLSFNEIDELGIFYGCLLLRDAIIYNCSKTDSGLNYLNDCYFYEQEDPDRPKLEEHSMK